MGTFRAAPEPPRGPREASQELSSTLSWDFLPFLWTWLDSFLRLRLPLPTPRRTIFPHILDTYCKSSPRRCRRISCPSGHGWTHVSVFAPRANLQESIFSSYFGHFFHELSSTLSWDFPALFLGMDGLTFASWILCEPREEQLFIIFWTLLPRDLFDTIIGFPALFLDMVGLTFASWTPL